MQQVVVLVACSLASNTIFQFLALADQVTRMDTNQSCYLLLLLPNDYYGLICTSHLTSSKTRNSVFVNKTLNQHIFFTNSIFLILLDVIHVMCNVFLWCRCNHTSTEVPTQSQSRNFRNNSRHHHRNCTLQKRTFHHQAISTSGVLCRRGNCVQ